MKRLFVLAACAVATVAGGAAPADALRANVAFNTGVWRQAAEQPQGGTAALYETMLSGGDLDGCTAAISETLFSRDQGAWGIFDIMASVACESGGFDYVSSGAWEGSGFHGAGHVVDGSGSGDFEGLSGRVAQIGASIAPGEEADTLDVSYDLIVDRAVD
jgi:hypothetical protein